MDRLNPGRKRQGPPRIDDFEVAQRAQRNSLFFTQDDDMESIFGGDVSFADDPGPSQHPLSTRTEQPRSGYGQPPAQPVHSSTPAPVPVPDTIEIKDENDSDGNEDLNLLRSTPQDDRVKIFVGKRNRPIYVKRTDLAKSPVLKAYIVDDAIQGPFIMRPQLMRTNFGDFEAVSQYLRSGEYAPMLLEDPTEPGGPMVLDNVKVDESYAKELVRSGRLYKIAKRFQVEGMAELVFRKVSQVDPGKFNVQSLVTVAEIVFRNQGKGADSCVGHSTDNAQDAQSSGVTTIIDEDDDPQDVLEEWIIGKLAHNFREIMRIQRERFWEVVKTTNQKMMYARVLEEVAKQYRATGGNLPEPVVELD